MHGPGPLASPPLELLPKLTSMLLGIQTVLQLLPVALQDNVSFFAMKLGLMSITAQQTLAAFSSCLTSK